MGRVTTGIGVISGINTGQLTQALLAVDAEPVTDIKNKVTALQSQQSAYQALQSQLSPLLDLSTQFTSINTTEARQVQSSNPNVLSGTAQPGASIANYQLLAVRQASTLQLLSNGLADKTSTPVGSGIITIKQGGFVSNSTSLAQLNGGAGVQRGKISITDRSGGSATIDLSAAQTVGDVLTAINNSSGVRVRASVSGNSIVLSDLTGGSGSLSVQDLGGATTATDLGLAQTVNTSTLTSTNVNKLEPNLQLQYLNDGNGVRTQPGVNDFSVTTQDGSTFNVSLGSASTVGDVLSAINGAASNNGKVTASISSDGTHFQLTDNTTGSGSLTVTAINNSNAAADLGIAGSATSSSNVLTGGTVLAGLNTVLLKDLNGGAGITSLGKIQLTDRSGATATVDLSNATSLSDITNGLNAAGIGITAKINSAGDGITINDTTGSSAANLQISDVTGNTAASLNLVTNAAVSTVNSGDLKLRYISQNTQLSSLNNGQGVPAGKFLIKNSVGNSAAIDLTGSSVKTLGDVIQKINTAGINVTASINSTGDGLLLTDSAGGTQQLQVSELGGTTASALNIVGSGATQIDGALVTKISVGSSDSLSTVVQNINNLSGAGVTASILNDGTSKNPYHLELTSKQSGAAGNLLIDTGSTGLNLTQTASATNAVLGLGSGVGGAPAILFSSANDTFNQIASNLSVTLQGTSTTPTTLSVSSDTSPIANELQTFVSNFNQASSTLTTDLAYDPTTKTGGPLHGDPATINLQTQLYNLAAYQNNDPNISVHSLADLGITFNNGQLSINQNVLSQQLSTNAADVQTFLTDANSGFANKLQSVITQAADPNVGTLTIENNAIVTQLSDDQNQLATLTTLLNNEQAQLTAQFTNMESVLASLQASSSQLSQLTNVLDLINGTSSTSSSSSGSSSSGGGTSNIGNSGTSSSSSGSSTTG